MRFRKRWRELPRSVDRVVTSVGRRETPQNRVDRKNLTQISVELDDLAARARHRKLKLDEMQGGTFSISNLGGIGGTGFLADRQLARGGDPRGLARADPARVARGKVPAAADDAAVAEP
jgi:hypothetical protein